MTKGFALTLAGAVLALFLAAAPASAANWRVVLIPDEVPPLGRSVAFVDTDTITRDGDEIRFTYDIRFQAQGEILGLRTPARASCTAYWYELGVTVVYRGDTPGEHGTATPRQQAQDGSNIHGVIEAVCTGTFLSEPVDMVAHTRTMLNTR